MYFVFYNNEYESTEPDVGRRGKRILLLVHTAWNKEKLIQLNDDVSKVVLDIKSCCFPFKTETFMLGVFPRIGNAAGSWKECGCRLVSFSLSAATSLARLVGGRLIYSCKSCFLRPTSKLLVYRMRSRLLLSREATVFILSRKVRMSPLPRRLSCRNLQKKADWLCS